MKSRWADDDEDAAAELQRKKEKEEKKRAKAEKQRKADEEAAARLQKQQQAEEAAAAAKQAREQGQEGGQQSDLRNGGSCLQSGRARLSLQAQSKRRANQKTSPRNCSVSLRRLGRNAEVWRTMRN